MNIIVHLPSKEKQKEFQKNIVEIQASVIISKLNDLPIERNNKKKMLKELKKDL